MRWNRSGLLFFTMVFFMSGALSACSGKTSATEINTLSTASPVPSATSTIEATIPPTATQEPTLEPTFTATVTPIPALEVKEVNAWCMPAIYGAVGAITSASMPENGRAATQTSDGTISLLYPDSICTFSFTFNQVSPEGLSLKWFEESNLITPWLTMNLQTDPENEQVAFSTTNHSYVVAPPLWFIDYHIQLQAQDGSVLWEGPIHLERDWQPELCWNLVLPNPVTLLCAKMQDLHPWDPGYGIIDLTPYDNKEE